MFNNFSEIDNSKVKLIIYWSGFNACALITNSLINEFNNEEVVILTDTSYLSFNFVKTKSKFKFISLNEIHTFYSIEFPNLKYFIQTGWFNSEINNLGKYFKSKYKSKIIVTVDNIKKNSLKQFLGKFYIKYFFDKNIDYYLVPGIESIKLLKKFWVSTEKIRTGFYGAYEEIYFPGNIDEKQNIILYVGEISKRKGIDLLINTFLKINKDGWKLALIGKEKDIKVEKHKNILYYNFLPPDHISSHMQKAKIFVLPSRLDHWGTVVCEAAMCGCALIVSNNAGSSIDLIDQGLNGFIFFNKNDLEFSMREILNWNNDNFKISHNWSIKKSELYKSNKYLSSIKQIINEDN